MQKSTLKSIQVVFVVFFLIVLLYLARRQVQSIIQSQKAQGKTGSVQKNNQGFPMRLSIPTIHVDAPVEYLGLTANGAMDVPINTTDVGLFKFGAHPGDKGTAVIAGHFDGENGTAGVFMNLNKLKKGDKLYIDYANGVSIAFIVRQSRTYDPQYATDVFSGSDRAHLNLITCDGVWDKKKKSYSKRLVVFADISH